VHQKKKYVISSQREPVCSLASLAADANRAPLKTLILQRQVSSNQMFMSCVTFAKPSPTSRRQWAPRTAKWSRPIVSLRDIQRHSSSFAACVFKASISARTATDVSQLSASHNSPVSGGAAFFCLDNTRYFLDLSRHQLRDFNLKCPCYAEVAGLSLVEFLGWLNDKYNRKQLTQQKKKHLYFRLLEISQ